MAPGLQNIEGMLQEADSLWVDSFEAGVGENQIQRFSSEIESLKESYTSGDYISFLDTAHRLYHGFTVLGSGLNPHVMTPVTEAFMMRDIFFDLYVRVAREFVEDKLTGLNITEVDVFSLLEKDPRLLVIDPDSGAFVYVPQTQAREDVSFKGSYDKDMYLLEAEPSRTPTGAYIYIFDNDGNKIREEDYHKPGIALRITQQVLDKGLVYRFREAAELDKVEDGSGDTTGDVPS